MALRQDKYLETTQVPGDKAKKKQIYKKRNL